MAARTTADRKFKCELIVAGGHAPEVLEATERCFDPPAITIAPRIRADGVFA